MKLRYLIPSLLAAGFLPAKEAVALVAPPRPDEDGKKATLFDVFKLKHIYTLAGHSSHSSHASHASHYSHSSYSGGGYSQPSETYTPPSGPDFLTAPAPAPAPIPLIPSSDKAKLLIMKVQTDLRLFGYADVPVDGVIGPETRAALKQFQADWGLVVTGTITLQVLDAMGIPAT